VNTIVRYCWAAPATLFGLMVAMLALRGGRVRVVEGVVEAHGPLLRRALAHLVPIDGGAAAITIGHVMLGVSQEALDSTRAHERVHVRQYERWGPLFVPAYFAASLWALARRRHLYFDNRFEREACCVGRTRGFHEEHTPPGSPSPESHKIPPCTT
jgi:hypothetical protein